MLVTVTTSEPHLEITIPTAKFSVSISLKYFSAAGALTAVGRFQLYFAAMGVPPKHPALI